MNVDNLLGMRLKRHSACNWHKRVMRSALFLAPARPGAFGASSPCNATRKWERVGTALRASMYRGLAVLVGTPTTELVPAGEDS